MTHNLEKILVVFFGLFLLVVGYLFYSFQTQSNDRQAKPEQSTNDNELVIHVLTENLYPLSFLNEETGKVEGVATRIIEQVLEDTGYRFKIELLPWTDAYRRAVSEENTIIFSMARIPIRENKFIWLHKITDLYYSLYTPNKDLTNISLEQVKSHYITVTRNDISHHILQEMGFSKFVFISQNIRYSNLLARDQIDFMLTNDLWILQNQDSLPVPLYRQEQIEFKSANQSMYYAINANTNPAVVFRIKRSFENITDADTFDILLAPYRTANTNE